MSETSFTPSKGVSKPSTEFTLRLELRLVSTPEEVEGSQPVSGVQTSVSEVVLHLNYPVEPQIGWPIPPPKLRFKIADYEATLTLDPV
jgi:hypothetical protein